MIDTSNPAGSKHSYTSLALKILHAAIFTILCFLILQAKKIPSSDDWIYVNPLGMESTGQVIAWLFEQNVDHRIPFQRLLQYLVARGSGFDMRALMLVNAFLALATSAAIVQAAYLYRGERQRIGDYAIPLIILTPAAGYSLWAIHLQFLSSILVVSLALFFWARHQHKGDTRSFFWGCACMIILPLCGMNGAIFSSVISLGCLIFLAAKRSRVSPYSNKFIFFLALSLVSNLAVWTAWKPSYATSQNLSAGQALKAVFELLPASMFAYSQESAVWKSLLVFALVIAAIIVTVKRALRHSLSLIDMALALTVFASLLIMISVSMGRGQTSHLVFHYGNLTILTPIVSWIIISKGMNSRLSILIGIPFLLLFAAAYTANLEWRSSLILSKRDEYAKIDYSLKHTKDPGEIIDKHREEFLWTNEPQLAAEQKDLVVRGINILRSQNYPIYTLNPCAQDQSTN